MNRWVNTKTGMPNEDIACVVLRNAQGSAEVYPKFAEWDGIDWVDIDGDPVSCVIAWTKAPTYDSELDDIIKRITGCVDNDTCEIEDCCYYTAADRLQSLLEYIND